VDVFTWCALPSNNSRSRLADSFRVSLDEIGARLPYLWTAKAALVKPSQAYALPVETSDVRYFIRARAGGTSIYHPEGLNTSLQGSGSVRIRKVLPPDQGRTTLEGTLVMQERFAVSPHDLLWIGCRCRTAAWICMGTSTTDGLARMKRLPHGVQARAEVVNNVARGGASRSRFAV
jgi:hypothetical protein